MSSFVDRVRIYVKGGDGGNGAVSFRREKYVPRGGPDGGDGGRGGDVVFVVDAGLNSLLPFRYRRHYQAERGSHGQGSNRHGKSGADLEVRVPPGTLVRDEGGRLLADLTEPGQRFVAARGGRGGRGNARFATATHQAPRMAERGEPGEERWLWLDLKLLADVGLVGLPNAGKSTLLARVSAARPKTAPYPFTTLEPVLGVVRMDDGFTMVWADIPGLIEGAHRGAGLGHDFLRHIERTRLLVHVVDAAGSEGRDPVEDYRTVRDELERYDPRLTRLPAVLAANKTDLPMAEEHLPRLERCARSDGLAMVVVSAVTGVGIERLLGQVRQQLEAARAVAAVEAEGEAADDPKPAACHRAVPPFTVEREPDGFRVRGRAVERWAAMTDFDNDEAVRFFQRRLRRAGIDAALREAGAQPGSVVRIGTKEFELATVTRIGILGGTFDPIHYGHLIVAEAARTALALDSIVFVPCGQPPHKDPCAITAAEHRYLMTVLATSERRRFRVSRIELDRPGPSYTVDTLREFQRTDGRGAELFFIVGADAFLQMPSWKSPEEVMRLARIVVVNRSGHNGEQLAERLQALQPSLRQRVEIVPSVPIHISAHELRQRLRRGISIRGYVPPPVLTYIEEHALYQS